MTPEQRQEIIRLLEKGEELSTEWARILFPPEKREYELVYHGKEREEDILANTLAVPLQPVRTFGSNGEWSNMLIFGDNLQVMKTLLEMKKAGKLCNAGGTPGVRLIYIDPPFATKQEFRGSEEQKAYQDKIAGAYFIEFLRKRLVFLKELLSEDGSIYVYLDWKKGHYVKTIIDEIFGENNFQNEITWYYPNKIPDKRKPLFTNAADMILFYAKRDGEQVFNPQYFSVAPHKRAREIKVNGIKQSLRDEEGNVVYNVYDKRLVDCVWNIPSLAGTSGEQVNYPTQKPEAVLTRIISASSDKGDVIFDCFAGSGTTLAVAEKLGRRWIGVDCGKLAIYATQKRLLNIADSKSLENPQKKYGKQCKPFTL